MLAIGIHFLTGRYAACRYNDRNRPEWPPEFARLYSAMVDAWATADRDGAETAALQWLACLGAPAIWASAHGERAVRRYYVPVNDAILVGSHNDQAKTHVAWWTVRLTHAVLQGVSRDELAALAEEALLDLDEPSSNAEMRLFELARQALESGAEAGLLAAARKLAPRAARELGKHLKDLATKATKDPAKGDRAVLLPEARTRQDRTFPVAFPERPEVYFVWRPKWMSNEEAAQLAHVAAHRPALEALLGRVTRLGHSSSLVTCWLAEQPPSPNWLPDPDGGHVLRAVADDQLEVLQASYTLHRGVDPRVLPARNVRYRTTEERPPDDVPHTIHSGGWFVFERLEGPPLPIQRAADVAAALRGAILRHASDPPPELLSGHRQDGRPSQRPHAAFVPLPFVGRPHATGQLMGAAVVLPRDSDEAEAESLLVAIGRWRRAHAGQAKLRIDARSTWTVAYVSGLPEHWALREARWIGVGGPGASRAARRWRSVTPVALARNPGKLYSRDAAKAARAWATAEAILREDVARAGLPEPLSVSATFQALVTGSRPATAFSPFPRRTAPGRYRRVLVHTEIVFPAPVRGPLLLGAGRHLGLGLFVPLADPEQQP